MSDFMHNSDDDKKNYTVKKYTFSKTEKFNNTAERRKKGVSESKSPIPVPVIIFISLLALIYLLVEGGIINESVKEKFLNDINFLTQNSTNIKIKDITPVKIDIDESALPPEEVLKEACLWKKNFNLETYIELIPTTEYIREYWPSGNPKSLEPTVNGLRHGMGFYTFDNGKNYAMIPWKHGKKHGAFTLFREDGTIEQALSYKDGEQYGINQWYSTQGKVIASHLYIDQNTTLPPLACANYLTYEEEYEY